MLSLYRRDKVTSSERAKLSRAGVKTNLRSNAEWVYYVEFDDGYTPTDEQIVMLQYALAETFDPDGLRYKSFLGSETIIEIGPQLSFETTWGSTARGLFHAIGIPQLRRIERARRYGFVDGLSAELETAE